MVSNLYDAFYNMGLKYYSVKAKDGVSQVRASTHKDVLDIPITDVGHNIATGVSLKVDVIKKHVYIQKMNSKIKGTGTKMVDAIMEHFSGYDVSVTDQSRRGTETVTFWDKMKVRHPSLSVVKSNISRINHMLFGLQLSMITRGSRRR